MTTQKADGGPAGAVKLPGRRSEALANSRKESKHHEKIFCKHHHRAGAEEGL